MSFVNSKPHSSVNASVDDVNTVVKSIPQSVEQKDCSVLVFKTRPTTEYNGQMNENADPSKGIYISASYQNKTTVIPIKVLIDSGSTMSLLDKSVYDRIPAEMKPVLKETEKQIKFADGSIQKSEGIVKMPLQCGNIVASIEFLLGKYTDDAILGMKDIHNLGLNIDFHKMIVKQGKNWLPVHDTKNNLVGRKVVVRRNVIIPPRCQFLVQADIEGLCKETTVSENTLMLETNNNVFSELGILPAKSMHQVVDDGLPVLLYNPSEDEVELWPDLELGELTEVEIVGECDEQEIKVSKTEISRVKDSEQSVM